MSESNTAERPELTTPEDILGVMAGTLARCRTYSDCGRVVTWFHPTARAAYPMEKRFCTAFVRPDRFRFECRDHLFPEHLRSPDSVEQRLIVWGRGTEALTWCPWEGDSGGLQPERSLLDAIRALGGVTSMASQMVPFLLLSPAATGKPWKLLDEARVDDRELDGSDCYRVQGRFPQRPGWDEVFRQEVRETLGEEEWNPQTTPTVFWIEKRSLLLRRFEWSVQLPQFRAETVVTYEPRIDVPISDDQLELGVDDV